MKSLGIPLHPMDPSDNLSIPPPPPGLNYVAVIDPSLTLLMISLAGASMLIPIGIALFFFSNSTQRKRPVFILNVISVAAGLVQGVLSVYNQVCYPHPAVSLGSESLTFPFLRVVPS